MLNVHGLILGEAVLFRKRLHNRTIGTVRMIETERREELRRFLKDRRARVRPAEAGLPATPRRRVAGLRREEVAALAGIGVSWYTALENGDAHGFSDETVLAVAEALRLSESERQYLLALTGHAERREPVAPNPLVVDTLAAIAFPAYIVTSNLGRRPAMRRSAASGLSAKTKCRSMRSSGFSSTRVRGLCMVVSSARISRPSSPCCVRVTGAYPTRKRCSNFAIDFWRSRSCNGSGTRMKSAVRCCRTCARSSRRSGASVTRRSPCRSTALRTASSSRSRTAQAARDLRGRFAFDKWAGLALVGFGLFDHGGGVEALSRRRIGWCKGSRAADRR